MRTATLLRPDTVGNNCTGCWEPIMLCPSCNQENPGFANFCQYCGFQFRDPPVDLMPGRAAGPRHDRSSADEPVSPGIPVPEPPVDSPWIPEAEREGRPTGRDDAHPEMAADTESVARDASARDFYDKGVSLFNSRDYEASLAVMELATGLDPGMDTAWNARGVCLARLRKYEEAVFCYEKAIAIDPANGKYRDNLHVTRMKMEMARAKSRSGHQGPAVQDSGRAGRPQAPDPLPTLTAAIPVPPQPVGAVSRTAPPSVPDPLQATRILAAGGSPDTPWQYPSPVKGGYPNQSAVDPPLFYAWAWIRWVAYFVDSFIALGICLVVILPVLFLGRDLIKSPVAFGAIFIAVFAVYLLYFALCESSKKQATPGKRLFHLVVTGRDGSRLSFVHALARNLVKLPCTAGYLQVINGCVIWVSPEGKGIHDYIAGTLVLTPGRTSKEYTPAGPRVTTTSRLAIAVLIILCVIGIVILAAAVAAFTHGVTGR